MTSKKKQNSLIVSVSSKDIIYCLSVYESGDAVLTPYKHIQHVYNKLGIKTIRTKYLFLWVLLSKWKMIYVFGQGPTFFLLYFRKVLSLFKKRLFYSDAYLAIQTRMTEPLPTLQSKTIYQYFPDWLVRFLKFGLYGENGYYWLNSCFIIVDPIVAINPKITVNCKNHVIILDEILIDFPNLLDFKRLASKHPLYLKRKSHGWGDFKVDPEVLKNFSEHIDTIVPIEFYRDYHTIIGSRSTSLGMPNSISICKLDEAKVTFRSVATRGDNQVESVASYMPETLEELYLYLDC